MAEAVLSTRLTADGGGLKSELRSGAAELQRLGNAAQQANMQGKTAADEFTRSLKRQADTIGMTKAQTLAYEASQHQLTRAQRESAAASIKSIDAHERHEKVLGRVRVAAAAAGTAMVAAFVAIGKASIDAAMQAEQSSLRLDAVLKATGGSAGLSRSGLDAMAESMKRRLGFDDDAMRDAMAQLLTFKQIGRESFGDTLEMAANLSKVMKTDLASAVMQLGKALEDPESGLTALRRSGVSFNDTQRDMIKQLVDTGRQAEAITMILQVMKTQGLDGVAAAMNQGLYKASNDLKLEWEDLLKALGRTDGVGGTAMAVFAGITTEVNKLRNVLEQGDWFDRLMMVMGGSTPLGLGNVLSGPARLFGHKPPQPPIMAGAEGGFETAVAQQESQLKQQADRRAQAEATGAAYLAREVPKMREEERRKREAEAKAAVSAGERAAREREQAEKRRVDEQLRQSERIAQADLRAQQDYQGQVRKLQEAQKAARERDMKAWFAMIDAEQAHAIELGRVLSQGVTENHRALERQREESKRAREAELEEHRRFNDEIGRGLSDALMRGFEDGKDAAANARDTIVNMFKTMVLRPVIQAVLSPVTGAITGTLGGLGIPGLANAGGAGGGIGNVLSGASSIGNLFTGGSPFSMATNLVGNAAAGAGFLGASPMFGALGGAELAGIAALEGGGIATAGMGAMSALGTAIPVIGGALAVAGLLRAFGSKKTPAVGTGYNLSGSFGPGGLDIMSQGLTNKGPENPQSQMHNALYRSAFDTLRADLDKLLRPLDAAAADRLGAVTGRFSFSQGMGVKDDVTAAQMVRGVSNDIIGQLVPGLREMARANEELIDTLQRVGAARRQADVEAIFSRMSGVLAGADEVSGLWMSELSPLTARARLDRAGLLYRENVAGVRAGDLNAIGSYSGVTRAYAQEARSFYASSPDYTAIFDEIQRTNSDLVTDTLTEQSMQFADMGLTLKDINANVDTMRKEVVAALERATAANVAAREAIVRAQQDGAEKVAQAQIEAQREAELVRQSASVLQFNDTGGDD